MILLGRHTWLRALCGGVGVGYTVFLLLAVLVMTRPAGALEHAAGVLCQLACHDEGIVVNVRADLVDLVLCRFRMGAQAFNVSG